MIASFAGTLVYNAQSPDEAALVSAARNFGYIFVVKCFHISTALYYSMLINTNHVIGKESIHYYYKATAQGHRGMERSKAYHMVHIKCTFILPGRV